ncbi:hypothetical protein FXF50_28480 [Micromonospora sp. AP08]|uniref:hypothetical protein n=1 Tax=Micromonospora sp. AP08 TaxID=2604467 RepID=UPI0011DC41B8|nr:hypothetical protein [Micromonospora sp. AP08]TYB34256.1 hypothetical protein FXF50_28480 [Micromonospora sp. AP08]
MTTHLEDQLVAGMRDQAAGLTLSRDVLGAATRRHRRRTALHRTAYAAGVVGVAGALTAALTVSASTPGDRPGPSGPVAGRPAPSASPQSPQLRLAAAAAASENISYRVKVTTTSLNEPPPKGELPEPSSERWVTTGAFDPTTATGYLDSPYTGLRPAVAAGPEHLRLVGGVLYFGGRDGRDPDNGKIVWSRFPGRQDTLDYDMAMGGRLGASASPEELLRVLTRAGATVTEQSPGVYRFDVSVPDPSREIVADRLVGEVTVGADDRIARVSYDRTSRMVRTKDYTYRLKVVIELSGYGLPVKVKAPAGALLLGR